MDVRVDDLSVPGPRGRVLAGAKALSVPAGGSLGLAGPSGAGKSTLLFALAGLLPQARGKVLWDGTDLIGLGARARRRMAAQNFGFVFQDFLLFDELGAAANAAAHAMFAPRAQRAAIRTEAAQRLGALGLHEADTRRPAASFSGGERQRIAVARALATRPGVLFADEPTASLDRAAADALINDLTATARAQGITLICVSHDPALLDRMDRVLHMRDGHLAETADA